MPAGDSRATVVARMTRVRRTSRFIFGPPAVRPLMRAGQLSVFDPRLATYNHVDVVFLNDASTYRRVFRSGA
jgi:hypothetical protein